MDRASKQTQKGKTGQALPLIPASHVRAFEQILRSMLAWKEEKELPDDLYINLGSSELVLAALGSIRANAHNLSGDVVGDMNSLGALLQAVVRDLPHPMLTPMKTSLWTKAAVNAVSDPRESTRIFILAISSLPPQYRHVLLLLLRHLRSVVNDLSSEQASHVIESWSKVLWSGDPSPPTVMHVVECLLLHLQDLLGAFALTEKEREVYHGIQTYESRSMLYDLLPKVVEQCIESEETARLATAFGSRWFAEFFDDKELLDKITSGVNRNLTEEEFPTWLKSIRIHSLSLGVNFPSLSKARLYPTRVGRGELAASMWIDLNDGPGRPGVIVDVEVAIPMTGICLVVSLKVHVKTFCGRFWLFLPGPFEDPGFGWASIEGIPDLAFKTEITVGSLPASYLSLVCGFVEDKLREGFLREWTLPQWKRLEMPWFQPKMKVNSDWPVERVNGKNFGPLKAGSDVVRAVSKSSAVMIDGRSPPRLVPVVHKIPPVHHRTSLPHGDCKVDMTTRINTGMVAKTMDGLEFQERSSVETHSLIAKGDEALLHSKSMRDSHTDSYDSSIVLVSDEAKISTKTSTSA